MHYAIYDILCSFYLHTLQYAAISRLWHAIVLMWRGLSPVRPPPSVKRIMLFDIAFWNMLLILLIPLIMYNSLCSDLVVCRSFCSSFHNSQWFLELLLVFLLQMNLFEYKSQVFDISLGINNHTIYEYSGTAQKKPSDWVDMERGTIKSVLRNYWRKIICSSHFT